ACRSSDSPTSGEISDMITALIAAKTAVPMLIATPKPTSMPSLLGRYESSSPTLNPSCRLRHTRRRVRSGYTERLPQKGAHAAATSQGCELPPSRATPAAKKFPARASGAPMKESARGHLSDGPLGERSVSIASDIVSTPASAGDRISYFVRAAVRTLGAAASVALRDRGTPSSTFAAAARAAIPER